MKWFLAAIYVPVGLIMLAAIVHDLMIWSRKRVHQRHTPGPIHFFELGEPVQRNWRMVNRDLCPECRGEGCSACHYSGELEPTVGMFNVEDSSS